MSISHKTQDSMLGVIEMVPESYLGGGFNFFKTCSSVFGEMIQFEEHIFQMGSFNHQRVLGFTFFFCVSGNF